MVKPVQAWTKVVRAVPHSLLPLLEEAVQLEACSSRMSQHVLISATHAGTHSRPPHPGIGRVVELLYDGLPVLAVDFADDAEVVPLLHVAEVLPQQLLRVRPRGQVDEGLGLAQRPALVSSSTIRTLGRPAYDGNSGKGW